MNQMALLTVSVLLPVRNGERFLAQALDSLIAQRGIDFEIIAIDDGSSDATPAVLARYAALYHCLRLATGEGRGISHALNLGLALARGRYIARMDADDIAFPDRFAVQSRHLDQHPAVGVLGTQALRIDVDGVSRGRIRVPTGQRRVRAALAISSALIHPTVMMRREPLLAVGGYRSLFDGAEDYDLWLRLSEFTELDNLAEPWLWCRRHGAQVSTRHALRQARRSALALVTHGFRQSGIADSLAECQSLGGWRQAFAAVDPVSVARVHALTVAALVDNSGSLRPRGSAYLLAICKAVNGWRGDRRLAQRIALACVRHQLQLLRNRRWRELIACLLNHLLSCHVRLLKAYFIHASILWRS
jgi:hypothetical protein